MAVGSGLSGAAAGGSVLATADAGSVSDGFAFGVRFFLCGLASGGVAVGSASAFATFGFGAGVALGFGVAGAGVAATIFGAGVAGAGLRGFFFREPKRICKTPGDLCSGSGLGVAAGLGVAVGTKAGFFAAVLDLAVAGAGAVSWAKTAAQRAKIARKAGSDFCIGRWDGGWRTMRSRKKSV